MLSVCPFCEHQNPAGAKFCNECGSPLHLTPCGGCGAVNSLADTHCWRCGERLLPLDSPVPVERSEREQATPALPSEQELEQELVALEQEVQALKRAPKSAEARSPVVEHAPRGPGIPGSKAADPQPRRVEQEPRRSDIPELRSLFVPADDARRGRRRGLAVTTLVVALGSAIAVGAYFRERDRASPERAASATPPTAVRAEPSTPPSAVRTEPSTPPSAASNVAEAPVAAPRPALPPGLKALDAPTERRIASDAGEAPPVPAPAAAPEPSCPPAVEAMTLCDWLDRANRQ